MSKYGNRKIHHNGMVFDSKKEYVRYLELQVLQKNNLISDLRRQVDYELIPKKVDADGRCLERAIKYRADFVYYDNELKQEVVEDVKGMKTPDYIIKRKLLLYTKGIRILEI